jgi:hypothetical protein
MALSLPEPDSRAACGVARHPEGDPRAHCGAIFCRGKVQETGARHPMRRRRVTGISTEGIARVSHENPADFAVNLRRLNLLPPLERARGGKDHRGLRARQERLADGEAQAGARVDHADSRPLPHRSAAFDWRPASRKSSLTRTAFSTPRRTSCTPRAASVRSAHCGGKAPERLRKHEFRKSRSAQIGRRREEKP